MHMHLIKTVIVIIFLFFYMSSSYFDNSYSQGVEFENGIDIKGPNYQIYQAYGITKGKNLFHNFRHFNIYSKESVTFHGDNIINNVICRISDNEYSWINGSIYMGIQNANLFLLNPNGFIFGQNSSIHMNGTFHVSTADYIRMEDNQTVFTCFDNNELFSSSPPEAFGFINQTKSSIEFQNAHLSGSSISIVGGDIILQNSEINAPGGDIYLANYNYNGDIPTKHDVNIASCNKGNIILKNKSLIDVSGKQSGNIYIHSNELFVTNASIIKASNKGDGGGEINIQSNKIFFSDQSKISSETILLPNYVSSISSMENDRKGGDVNINASESLMFLNSDIKTYSVSFNNDPANVINAGNVSIRTRKLSFSNSSISSGSIDGGNSGDIFIYANESFLFKGYLSYVRNSLDSIHGSDAGNIMIQSKNISFIDGAGINTHVHGGGRGGDVKLFSSNNINFVGIDNGHSSRISTTTFNEKDNPGNAGNIILYSPFISFKNGGGITANSSGTGNGGKVKIVANEIEFIGANLSEEYKSGISSASTSLADNSGNAGEVDIKANRLYLAEGAAINTEAQNAGGGKITIDCNDFITLINGEVLTSVKNGKGNSGDISIDSDFVVLNHSTIKANAFEGDGGAIFIDTDNYIKSTDSIIEASSKRGNDGKVTITSVDLDFTGDINSLNENFLQAENWLKTPGNKRSTENESFLFTNTRDGIPNYFDDLFDSPPFIFEKNDLNKIFIKKVKDSLINSELLFYNGNFAHIIKKLNNVLNVINIDDNPVMYVKIIVYLSHSFKAIGHFNEALYILKKGIKNIKKYNNSFCNSLLYCTLSDVYLILNQTEKVRQSLVKAKKYSHNSNNFFLCASILNHMANLYFIENDFDEAIRSYKKSLDIIKQLIISDKPEFHYFQSRVLMNYSRVLWIGFQKESAYSFVKFFLSLQKTYNTISKLPETYEKAALLISIGILAREVHNYILQCKKKKEICQCKKYIKKFSLMYKQSLLQALTIGEKIKNNCIKSIANGYLGQFFFEENYYTEAILYTTKAIFYSNQDYLPEWQYFWQWQLGRMYKSKGDIGKYIELLQSAQQIINPLCNNENKLCQPGIIHEFFNCFRLKNDIFSEKIKPLYLELSEYFLEKAKSTDFQNLKQQLYIQAIENLEHLKIIELQNYFHDECITESAKKLYLNKNVFKDSALLYPIEFADHITILLVLSNEIKEFSINVDMEHFQIWAIRFTERVQDISRTYQFKPYAIDIYDWLIRPVENELIEKSIKSLYIVPDGIIRTIPFAALIDRESDKYLIEKYSLAIIPSMKITNFQKNDQYKNKILLAGLSVSRHGFPALTNVPFEIDNIKKIIDGKILLNNLYTTQQLKTELNKKDYDIVHISSHAMIGEKLEDTFILAYNKKIKVNDLNDLISINKYNENPLEIITLSACETAIGDQKAALGLAGIVLKAGAKNAIATLWSINDKSTVFLMTEFYRQLLIYKQSKAKSLQLAQKMLINHSNIIYRHPSFWAAFLLIGK